jgi:hypothetical protein
MLGLNQLGVEMRNREVAFQHGAMRVSYTSEAGVAVVIFRGLVTPVSLRAHAAESPKLIRKAFAGGRPHAFFFRFDRATVLVNEDTLNVLYDELSADSPMQSPASILVRPEVVPHFQPYADRLMSMGVGRAVFTEPSQAHAWVFARAPA